MKKLINISQKLDTLFKILQRITAIGTLVAILVVLVLTVVNAINPDAVIGENLNVDIGPITVELAQELAPDNRAILTYTWGMIVVGAVFAAGIYYALSLVRKILQPMMEGKPFDSMVGQNIRKIGFVTLVLGIIQNVAVLIDTIGAVKTFQLIDMNADAVVRSVTVNYSLDLTFLIVFFVLLLMSHIFNYGTELQQLSDETL